MFRPRFTIALAILVSSLATVRLPAQQGASLEYRADALVSAAGKAVVEKLVIQGAADMLVGYRFPGMPDKHIADGNARPSVAFVITSTVDGSTFWSESAWLSIFGSLLALAPAERPADIWLLAVKAYPEFMAPVPGDPLLRGPTLREALFDLGLPAVIVLDFDGPPAGLIIRAAANRSISPRRVLEVARNAATVSGTSATERPVADFYAAAGLAQGNALLGQWLESGVSALAVTNESLPGHEPGSINLGNFALALSDEVSHAPRGRRGNEDVNYLRLPLPVGVLTLGDRTIIVAALSILAIIALAAASGLLNVQRRKVSVAGLVREAMTALALAFLAFAGARLLSDLAINVLRRFVDPVLADGNIGAWFRVVSLAAHLAGALCWFYTSSGFTAMIGLHGDHGRIDAAMGSLALLCAELVITIAAFPPAAPFFIVAIAFAAFTSESAVASGLGLLATALVFLPFADPRVLAEFRGSSAGYATVASRLLELGLGGTAAIAAVSAPFGLWLVAASSPVARLRRGRRTAPVWLFGAFACAATEAALRLAFGTS